MIARLPHYVSTLHLMVKLRQDENDTKNIMQICIFAKCGHFKIFKSAHPHLLPNSRVTKTSGAAQKAKQRLGH